MTFSAIMMEERHEKRGAGKITGIAVPLFYFRLIRKDLEVFMSADSTLLSIVIPTFNRATLLEETLESLILQLESLWDEIELWISDNASNDNTEEIVKNYQNKYRRIKYYRHEKNTGSQGNFVNAFQIATGKFVWLISDDDIVLPGALIHIVDYLKLHSDVRLVHLNNVTFKGDYDPAQQVLPRLKLEQDVYTCDKGKFGALVGCHATFITTLIFSAEQVKKIEKQRIEEYKRTDFVQAFIGYGCTKENGSGMGVIAQPCVAARANARVSYNMYELFGVNVWKIIEFACRECAYPQKIMENAYIDYWRTTALWGIIGAKVNGFKHMYSGFGKFFKVSCRYYKAWIFLYPFLILPAPFYKFAKKIKRLRQ